MTTFKDVKELILKTLRIHSKEIKNTELNNEEREYNLWKLKHLAINSIMSKSLIKECFMINIKTNDDQSIIEHSVHIMNSKQLVDILNE
jgi:hypothetical protein